MAHAAKELGYQYILITDHSKAVTVANGLSEERAVENIQRIHAARKKVEALKSGRARKLTSWAMARWTIPMNFSSNLILCWPASTPA